MDSTVPTSFNSPNRWTGTTLCKISLERPDSGVLTHLAAFHLGNRNLRPLPALTMERFPIIKKPDCTFRPFRKPNPENSDSLRYASAETPWPRESWPMKPRKKHTGLGGSKMCCAEPWGPWQSQDSISIDLCVTDLGPSTPTSSQQTKSP